MRISIFTQIWIPFIAVTAAFIGLLWYYYPQRQEQILAKYKLEELTQLAKSLAVGVELSLDSDDFIGLEKSASTLQEGEISDFTAIIFTDSLTQKEDTLLVRPENFDFSHVRSTPDDHIVAKIPFTCSLSKGYVILGIHEEHFQAEIDNINEPIFASLIFLAAIFISVTYVISNRISHPIEAVTHFADELRLGNLNERIQSRKPFAQELRSLQESLNALGSTLSSQKHINDELTLNLESQVKQKTEHLQLAFNDLNTAQEIAHLANFVYDTANDSWKGSDNLRPLLGIDTNSEPIFQPLLRCIGTDYLDLLNQQLGKAIKETGRFEIQIPWTRPADGKLIWLDCIAYVYPGANKKALIRGVVQDITVRKLQEEELSILSNVAKRTSNLVILTDTDRRMQWVNDSVCEISGYTREELIGKTPRIFQSDKSDRDEIAKLNQAIQECRPVTAELINVDKSGKEYWISINLVPLFNEKGKHTGFMAVEADTTDRKNLEIQREKTIALLEESRNEIAKINAELEQKVEERTREIKNLALFPQQNPNPVLEVDINARKLNYLNLAAKNQLGAILDEPLDRLLTLCHIDTESFQNEDRINEAVINGRIYEITNFKLDEDNLLRLYLHDITDRKHNEERLQRTESDLKQKTVALQASLEELERTQNDLLNKERLSTLGVLIAGIAHEINTPLGAIKASGENLRALFTEGLMQLIPKFDPANLHLALQLHSYAKLSNLSTMEERRLTQLLIQSLSERGFELKPAQRYARSLVQMGITELDERLNPILQHPQVDMILQLSLNLVLIFRSIQTTTISADQGSKVVRALNTFAHGNLASIPSEFNLFENIETVVTIFWNKIKQGSSVTIDVPKDVTIFGLAEEMTQVWTNIINNALYASGNRCEIRFSYIADAEGHIIEVSNNGPQIPASIIERIFDPFFTTKSRGEGTGLGLNIVQEIVQKHKGRIRCESDAQITKFIITLPTSENGK